MFPKRQTASQSKVLVLAIEVRRRSRANLPTRSITLYCLLQNFDYTQMSQSNTSLYPIHRNSPTLGNLKINEIGPELIAEFASERQRDGLQISSVNSCLRALRRVLRLAVEWGVLESSPKVKFLSGEQVISTGEEALYLAAASPLLHDVSIALFDTGMRPEECHSLRWENVKLGWWTKWYLSGGEGKNKSSEASPSAE
jgi:integrase